MTDTQQSQTDTHANTNTTAINDNINLDSKNSRKEEQRTDSALHWITDKVFREQQL